MGRTAYLPTWMGDSFMVNVIYHIWMVWECFTWPWNNSLNNQLVQVVSFWSPTVGGHKISPLKGWHESTIPKGASAELPETCCFPHCFYIHHRHIRHHPKTVSAIGAAFHKKNHQNTCSLRIGTASSITKNPWTINLHPRNLRNLKNEILKADFFLFNNNVFQVPFILGGKG